MTVVKSRRRAGSVPASGAGLGKAAERAVAIICEPLDATPGEKAAAARVIDKQVADGEARRDLKGILGLDEPP